MNYAEVARAVDNAPKPMGEGYVAERHGFIKNLVLVWAPCGCVWVGDTKESFVTPCLTESCDYSYVETLEAVKALLAAEQTGPVEFPKEPSNAGSNIPASDIPVVGAEAGPGIPAQQPVSIAEQQAQEMISEGGALGPDGGTS